MRSLEECKAEVFRRSEKIIRNRKITRRCVIAACVPLVLVLSVCLAMIVPAMIPASAENEADCAVLENQAPEGYKEFSAVGNTSAKSVTIVVEGAEYAVFGEEASAAEEILQQLSYSPVKVCKCLPQFRVVTKSGSYGIHLSEGYARCEAGQAELTQEQVEILRTLILTAIPDWTPALNAEQLLPSFLASLFEGGGENL